MKPIDPATKELGDKCAWCLQDLSESYMLCAKFPVGYPLKVKEGTVLLPVELQPSNRVVHAIVMQPVSEGKQAGYDLIFGLCSEECTTHLKKAIEEDTSGFQLLN